MTPAYPVIRPATPSDAKAIERILAAAFYDDPPLRWIMPDASERSRLGHAFFQPFVELVLAGGAACITEDLSAACLWLTVDVTAPAEDDPAELRRRLIDGIGPENTKRFLVLDELFTAHHPGHASHDYLLFIGIVPALQNRGIGTAILHHRIDQLDRAGRPGYLEASSPRSAALYARLGFMPIGENITLPDGPTLYPMWRAPQPPAGRPSPAPADSIGSALHLPGEPA